MNRVRFLLLAPFAFLVISCNTALKPSGFLGKDDANLAVNKSLPFSRSWRNPDADLGKYSKVAVAPMKTDRLRSLGNGLAAASERNFGETARKDADEIATFAATEFQKEIDKTEGVSAVAKAAQSSKSKGVAILETNLVELVPGKPAAQVANFFVPFSGLLNRPSVGIEGRFVDARTGETLFAFSDREKAEISFIDRQKFTYYGVQRREISRWGKQLGKIVKSGAAQKVPDTFAIQPIAW